MQNNIEQIQSIQSRGFLGKLAGYSKMTGPGWLQAAVTLGGGSLVGALYLGIIGGYEFLWLIIRVPDMPETGKQSAAIVETIDIFPTLCDLTAIESLHSPLAFHSYRKSKIP